jgi:hypothetical protein
MPSYGIAPAAGQMFKRLRRWERGSIHKSSSWRAWGSCRPGANLVCPEGQELHDVMIIPTARKEHPLGVVISAPRCG